MHALSKCVAMFCTASLDISVPQDAKGIVDAAILAILVCLILKV